ncbi:hypothetical protein JD844_006079 [Phrynosoma platyrhinos]|uniref:Apolipoprotein A-I n=1 Tax=Phrynosoma platyrhinos TaxID=52577 RepID=A0ABQ7TS51_PHRPL|nr:hypothetical protein JD844_006079 [Phrynosoma platyrhinos]
MSVLMKFYAFGSSKAGKAVSDQLNELFRPLVDLKSEAPEEISEAIRLMFAIPGSIMMKVYRTLKDMEKQSSGNFEQVLKALAAYLDPALVKVSSLVEPLLHRLGAKIHEIDEEMTMRLYQSLESMEEELSFYVKRMEEIRADLQPLVEEVAKECKLGMETLNKNLKPYLDPLLKEADKYRNAFTEWIDDPAFPPKQS